MDSGLSVGGSRRDVHFRRGVACVGCQDIGNRFGQDIGNTMARTWVTGLVKDMGNSQCGKLREGVQTYP
jgi:hypothetical protein